MTSHAAKRHRLAAQKCADRLLVECDALDPTAPQSFTGPLPTAPAAAQWPWSPTLPTRASPTPSSPPSVRAAAVSADPTVVALRTAARANAQQDRSLASYLAEWRMAERPGPHYLSAAMRKVPGEPQPPHASHRVCELCGYESIYRCPDCTARTCSSACMANHSRTCLPHVPGKSDPIPRI
ncbi:hypothetical protein CXG81DRAFT_25037 [Caulochytrium protostelioides]|uniref:HIT-type domain-containing protein n=1 Tax=Caulochytrium protostelioides TaxID=1555241 RepID=A0A4P9XAI2_9FUNG|nr:hypothetical protein CXG81DRAFT_25037 [Caulochytrium protostelioides]|eukprot:RKP02346.1 hypothetical protein CXG81DRAFT_25037 [Caulochytrium protostelioides]